MMQQIEKEVSEIHGKSHEDEVNPSDISGKRISSKTSPFT
jgi:hypothetical protein